MFGTEEKAEEFYNYFNDKLEYIRTQLEGVEKRSLYIEGTSELSTIFPGDPMFDMVEYAFADNILRLTMKISTKEKWIRKRLSREIRKRLLNW